MCPSGKPQNFSSSSKMPIYATLLLVKEDGNPKVSPVDIPRWWVSSSGGNRPGHWLRGAGSQSCRDGSLLLAVACHPGHWWAVGWAAEPEGGCLASAMPCNQAPGSLPCGTWNTVGEPQLLKSALKVSKALAFSGWGNFDKDLTQESDKQFLYLMLKGRQPGERSEISFQESLISLGWICDCCQGIWILSK